MSLDNSPLIDSSSPSFHRNPSFPSSVAAIRCSKGFPTPCDHFRLLPAKKAATIAPEHSHRRRSLRRHLFFCREEEDNPSFPYQIRGVILFNGYHQTRETDLRSPKGVSLTDLVTGSLETQYVEERIREPFEALREFK